MIRFHSKTEHSRIAPRLPQAAAAGNRLAALFQAPLTPFNSPTPLPFRSIARRRPNPIVGLLSSAANPASSANSAFPNASVQAKKSEGGDFIHSETRKMTITPLSSTKMLQNSLRFFAIFVDFCAQNGPIPTQNHPSPTIPSKAGLARSGAVRESFSVPPLMSSANPTNSANSASPPLPCSHGPCLPHRACFCGPVKLCGAPHQQPAATVSLIHRVVLDRFG